VFYRRRRSTRVRWTQSSISTILHRLRHLFNHLILSTLETLSNEMLCISVCLIRPTARCFAFLACLWWCRPLEAGNISPGQVIDSWSCFGSKLSISFTTFRIRKTLSNNCNQISRVYIGWCRSCNAAFTKPIAKP
jgi:hypothetical protein